MLIAPRLIDYPDPWTLILSLCLLFVLLLQDAIRDGDFGRIEDIQGHVAMMFCAGGCKNYCNELLHFMVNLKYVWGDELSCVFIFVSNIHLSNIVVT